MCFAMVVFVITIRTKTSAPWLRSSRTAPRRLFRVGTIVAAPLMIVLAVLATASRASATEACAAGCPSTCVVGQLREGVCDSRGECVLLPERACPGGFACGDATTCKTKCEDDGACASGFVCAEKGKCDAVPASCQNGHFLARQGSHAAPTDCAPYGCADGASRCTERCANDFDCVAPNTCNAIGRCAIPKPDPAADTNADAGVQSCAIVPAPGRSGEGSLLVPLFVAAFALVSSLVRRRAFRPRVASSARSLPPARSR